MRTELVHLNSILLGGFSFYGDPISTKGGWDTENEIGKTFSRFTRHWLENPQRAYSVGINRVYEVHIYGPETPTNGIFEVFIGEEVTTSQLPINLSSKFIEAADYLKVTLCGEEIVSDWFCDITKEVLAPLGVRVRNNYLLQVYDERFKSMEQVKESIMEAYLPVERTPV